MAHWLIDSTTYTWDFDKSEMIGLFWLAGFNGILTLVGYLMPNPV